MKRSMWREYLAEWSWKKIKDGATENKTIWGCMYAAFISTFSLSVSMMEHDFRITDILMAAGMFLPLMFVMMSIMTHPVRLRKMRYLCPQTAEERIKSIRKNFYFRAGIHMMVFLAGLVLIFTAGFFNWESLLFLLLNDGIMSMMVPVYGTDGKASVQQIFLLVAAFLTDMAQLPIISGPEPHKMVQIILYAIFFLIELPLFIAFEKFRKKEMQAAGFFMEAM